MSAHSDTKTRFLPPYPTELFEAVFDKLFEIDNAIAVATIYPDTLVGVEDWDHALNLAYGDFWAQPVHKDLSWLLSVRSSLMLRLAEAIRAAKVCAATAVNDADTLAIEGFVEDAETFTRALDESLGQLSKLTLTMDQHFQLAAKDKIQIHQLRKSRNLCIERKTQVYFEHYLVVAHEHLQQCKTTSRGPRPSGATIAELESSLDRLEVALLEAEFITSD